MPKDFLNCVKNGGKVVTKKIDKDRYMHICYLDGKSYTGEIKYKESSKEKNSKRKK
jgi:hypothetical protein